MTLEMSAPPARRALAGCFGVLSMAVALPTVAQESAAAQRTGPAVLFSAPLQEAPNMNLTVVELVFAPNSAPPSTAERHGRGHRHPGSVLVYVTQGAVRLALAGEPVRVVHAGETFFEPPQAHHVIAESASATEPARAIAVMIVPEGAPLTVPEPQ
jgi:quercetin dioxygenase-like cupin family protein